MNLIYKILTLVSLLSFQNAFAVEMNFLYVGDDKHPAYLGAKQGLIEANLQGEFLNLKFAIDSIQADELSTTNLDKYSTILIANANTEQLKAITQQIPALPVFNLTNTDNSLRQMCIANAFHTIPNQQMYTDAEQQLLQKQPESKAKAQGWHPDFVKFAARDLNKRYKANAGIPMDDHAWAGWAAVKLTSDTVARNNTADPAVLMEYFKTSLKFDGQKGSNMGFRKTGQLEQLMLLVENDKIVTEAPVRGVAKSLDSLGSLECKQ